MKNYFFLFITIFSINTKAQYTSDPILYALEDVTGTARFRSMGGAFGALGGDFSALNINPAGSAIFIKNQASLSASSYNIKNKSSYFGIKHSATDNTFDLNQAGAVWAFDNEDQNSNWKKISLAVNYENTNNLNNSIFSGGINPTNSIADYFIDYANGIPSPLLNNNFEYLNYAEQQAYLGVRGQIISPVPGSSSNQYESNLSATGNYYHENSISSTGYNGKLSFNAATSYKDRLFLGINLNSHFVDYTTNTSFYEDYLDASNHDTTSGIQALRFSNDLYTYGTGFSFQLGAIAKLTNELRFGLSYSSPTWYRLNDELLQTLAVDCPDCATSNPFYVAPDLTINPTYKLRTPGKYNGSLAYVFGKSGLISFDYSFKDYTNIKLGSESDHANETNSDIAHTFDSTSEVRIGGEYRIKLWSLRGGYRFEQSPYKNGRTIGDLNSYSGGLGYNFGDFKVDLAYTLSKRDYEQPLFSRGFTDFATVNSKSNNITVTVLFEL